MQILLSTTGTASVVSFHDLGDRRFSHPTVNFNLLTEFTADDIQRSVSIQESIDLGHITVKDDLDNALSDLSSNLSPVREVTMGKLGATGPIGPTGPQGFTGPQGLTGPLWSPTYNSASSTVTATTTSTSDVLCTGMTLTPAAGVYMAWFSGSLTHGSNNGTIYTSLYVGGTIILESERIYNRPNSQITTGFSCMGIVTLNGSQALEGRWRVLSGTGTIYTRSLIIIRVG